MQPLLRYLLPALLLLPFAATARSNGFTLRNARHAAPVCRELRDILNQPENRPAAAGKPYVIPARYTHFTPVQWQDMPVTELSAHLNIDTFRKALELTEHPDYTQLRYQKAMVDFDNSRKLITMLRFRSPADSQWQCLVGKDAPWDYTYEFNYADYGGKDGDQLDSSHGLNCGMFSYDGLTYYTSVDSGSMTIYKASGAAPSEGVSLHEDTVCEIKGPSK